MKLSTPFLSSPIIMDKINPRIPRIPRINSTSHISSHCLLFLPPSLATGTCQLYTSEQCSPTGAFQDFIYHPRHSTQPPTSFSSPKCAPTPVVSPAVSNKAKMAKTDLLYSPAPGPTCSGVGVCCSNQFPPLPPGTPSVGTAWFQSDAKSMLADGARVRRIDLTLESYPYPNRT